MNFLVFQLHFRHDFFMCLPHMSEGIGFLHVVPFTYFAKNLYLINNNYENNTDRITSKWSKLSSQVGSILVQYFSTSVFCKPSSSSPFLSQHVLHDAIFLRRFLQHSHLGAILVMKELTLKWKHFKKSRYSRIFLSKTFSMRESSKIIPMCVF